MHCLAIIQARMSSSRLPKKVMAEISGLPMIKHIYDLCKKCNYVDKVIVATSAEQSDNELYEYCIQNKIDIYRGSLKNVLSRFVEIIDIYNPKFVVRVTGDCPFIYPTFIDSISETFTSGDTGSNISIKPYINRNTAQHTAQIYFSSAFTGTLTIQGSINPSNSVQNADFTDITSKTYTAQEDNDFINFTGVYSAVRFVRATTTGTLSEVLYRP